VQLLGIKWKRHATTLQYRHRVGPIDKPLLVDLATRTLPDGGILPNITRTGNQSQRFTRTWEMVSAALW
jgi:hypothetical protein